MQTSESRPCASEGSCGLHRRCNPNAFSVEFEIGRLNEEMSRQSPAEAGARSAPTQIGCVEIQVYFVF